MDNDNVLTNSPVSELEEIYGTISSVETITGDITPIEKIDGTLSPLIQVDGDITDDIKNKDILPQYEGEYEVVPKAFEETILETKYKKLIDDVVVKEITYIETSNLQGGVTVYIA